MRIASRTLHHNLRPKKYLSRDLQRKTTNQLSKMPPKTKTAKYETIKGIKCRRIPCNNPWQYTDDLAPIYETMRITHGETMDFECITTHKVKAQPLEVSENDNLYSIFAR